MRTRRRMRAGVVTSTVAASAVVVSARLAGAAFSAGDAATMALSTAALAAPTSLSATPGCSGPLTPRIGLTWTATTSTFATGYVIRRRVAAGVYATVATVTGRTTTSYTDTGPLLLNTQYEYVVHARYESWTTDSASATATTPALC